jgi:hypothetical protein
MGDYAREYGKKLYIYYLRESDSGTYECYLPNGHFNQFKLTVLNTKVNIAENYNSDYLPNSFIEQTQKISKQFYVEKNINDNVEMDCAIDHGNEEMAFNWRRIDGVF